MSYINYLLTYLFLSSTTRNVIYSTRAAQGDVSEEKNLDHTLASTPSRSGKNRRPAFKKSAELGLRLKSSTSCLFTYCIVCFVHWPVLNIRKPTLLCFGQL